MQYCFQNSLKQYLSFSYFQNIFFTFFTSLKLALCSAFFLVSSNRTLPLKWNLRFQQLPSVFFTNEDKITSHNKSLIACLSARISSNLYITIYLQVKAYSLSKSCKVLNYHHMPSFYPTRNNSQFAVSHYV